MQCEVTSDHVLLTVAHLGGMGGGNACYLEHYVKCAFNSLLSLFYSWVEISTVSINGYLSCFMIGEVANRTFHFLSAHPS